MVRKGGRRIETQEEEILNDDGGAGDKGSGQRGRLFEACPGQIDVEEEKEDAETDN